MFHFQQKINPNFQNLRPVMHRQHRSGRVVLRLPIHLHQGPSNLYTATTTVCFFVKKKKQKKSVLMSCSEALFSNFPVNSNTSKPFSCKVLSTQPANLVHCLVHFNFLYSCRLTNWKSCFVISLPLDFFSISPPVVILLTYTVGHFYNTHIFSPCV